MRRSILSGLIVLIPILLFVNVFQSVRYSRLERHIAELEAEQRELIEQNKRAILAISVLTSPDRIGGLAEQELELERVDPSRLLLVDTPFDQEAE
jgi:cell division protein FtsL